MISLIICARSKDIGQELKNNIQETIGVEYELVIIDNHNNQYNIFSAYNKGVAQSKYPLLCFMHDDIKYLSQNWGQQLVSHFAKPNVGAVGIAGAAYYPLLPGPWWSSGLIAKNIGSHTVQNNSNSQVAPWYYSYSAVPQKSLPVVVLDGVWFTIRKQLFDTISFDDKTFSGFHSYDIDICLQIHTAGYDILSVYDILIFHASSGNMNLNWVENCILLHKKWQKQLPASVLNLNYEQEVRAEYAAYEEFYQTLKKNGISGTRSFKITVNYILKYRIKRFNITFPFVLAKYTLRYFTKKLGLR